MWNSIAKLINILRQQSIVQDYFTTSKIDLRLFFVFFIASITTIDITSKDITAFGAAPTSFLIPVRASARRRCWSSTTASSLVTVISISIVITTTGAEAPTSTTMAWIIGSRHSMTEWWWRWKQYIKPKWCLLAWLVISKLKLLL